MRSLSFVEGLVLGVVVAGAVSYLITKHSIRSIVEEVRREQVAGRAKKHRRRSPSRCGSPGRRNRTTANHYDVANHRDQESVIREQRHLEQMAPPSAPMPMTTVAGSPRQSSFFAARNETTDDENYEQSKDPEGMSSRRETMDSLVSITTNEGNTSDPVPAVPQLRTVDAPFTLERMKSQGAIRVHDRMKSHEFGPGHQSVIEHGKAIEDAARMEEYGRVITPEALLTEESEDVCLRILECLAKRDKWMFKIAPERRPENRKDMGEAAYPSDISGPFCWTFNPLPFCQLNARIVDGVYHVYKEDSSQTMFPLPGDLGDFINDVQHILKIGAMGPVKTFCFQRLMLLEQKFNLHVMMNADKEFLAQRSAPHRDFYNVRKVDTHVHHSSCMNQKHLLRFIKCKLRKEPDEIVIFRDGKYLTLAEVFESLQLTGYDLNVDTMDMHADKNIFHRFDKFNLKYNPCGQSRLREIFMKQDNLIHGRYLAEITREVFDDLKASKYQHAEYRISIYGRKQVEWDILAAWICSNKLYSDNVVWLIQIPRLFQAYYDQGIMENFEQMLENIFQPLFDVTRDPETHPQLHVFLKQVVGFDMVDDESKPERRAGKKSPMPKEWSMDANPPYSYYAYYIYANLHVLNKFREMRGLNTFSFRPHAGEAGDIDHLTCAFMLCENIAHGINLRKSPCMQYLYYLAQIGLCMAPLSNNSLFLDYHRNPFPTLFARGLNVSLSTDDPLQIHLTKEPLVEEYSIAAQVWKLSPTDLCEIARNGVLCSGFPPECQKHWVAAEYWKAGPEGNDIRKTNVPNLRLRFRYDTHRDELVLLQLGARNSEARKNRASDVDT